MYARRLIALLVLSLGVALFVFPSGATAGHSIPVTVEITRVLNVFVGGAHTYELGRRPGDSNIADFYAGVTINGARTTLRFADHFHDKVAVDSWPIVVGSMPGEDKTVDVRIEVWDHDDCAAPFDRSCDDITDLDVGGTGELDLVFDRTTGTWTGDTTERCTKGGSTPHVFICFDIGTDGDGDGLFDRWEREGLDTDADGTIDVDRSLERSVRRARSRSPARRRRHGGTRRRPSRGRARARRDHEGR